MADTQSITAPERVYTSRAQRRDRSRRERWLAEVHKAQVARKISRGCRGWLDALAYRSDRYAKPVWGNQAKHGREIGCSARTIRRYRAEAEAAELIATQHGDVERLPDGRYCRRYTNVYRFNVPSNPAAARKARSGAAAKHARLTTSSTSYIQTQEQKITYGRLSMWPEDDPPPFSSKPPGGFEAMREKLRRTV